MSRSLNDIIKRSGFGEKMGIKIRKPRKSRANVYKNNIEYKTLSVSMENYSLKSTINEVIDYKKKVPRKEDVGKFIDNAVSNVQKFIDMIVRWIEKGIKFIQRAWDRFIGNEIEEVIEELKSPEVANARVSKVLVDETTYNEFVGFLENSMLPNVDEVKKDLSELIGVGGMTQIRARNDVGLLKKTIKYIRKHDGVDPTNNETVRKITGKMLMELKQMTAKIAGQPAEVDKSQKDVVRNRGQHVSNLLNRIYKELNDAKEYYTQASETVINMIRNTTEESGKKLLVENQSALVGFTRLLTENILKAWNLYIKEFHSMMNTFKTVPNHK